MTLIKISKRETKWVNGMRPPHVHGLAHHYCTARQCSLLRRKFMECSIISPAQSLLMKDLVIGQRQKKNKKKKKNSLLSIGHYMTTMVSIGQHFVTTRVVHLPKKDRTILLTEADLTIESNIAVRAVHSCNSWFNPCFSLPSNFELRLWLNFLHFVFRWLMQCSR